MFSCWGNIVKLLKQAKWGFIKNHYFNVLCGIKIYMRLFIFRRMPLGRGDPPSGEARSVAHDPAASSTCRAAAAVLVRLDRQMQRLIAVLEPNRVIFMPFRRSILFSNFRLLTGFSSSCRRQSTEGMRPAFTFEFKSLRQRNPVGKSG